MVRLVLAVALAAPTAAAAAEAPRAEVFGGYSHARHVSQETDGFQAGLDVSLGQSLGLEVSVSGHYKSELGNDLSWTSVFAGPRYAWRGERLTPFLHAQGGVVRSSAGIEVFDVSISEKDTGLGGIFGGGLDFGFARSWALRLQADYVLSHFDDGTEGDPRAALGIVYRAGRR